MRSTHLITSSILTVLLTTGCSPTLKKISGDGSNLAKDSNVWSCVHETKSGLTWEHKADYGKRWWNAEFTNTTNLGNEAPTDSRGVCHPPGGGQPLVTDESCHTGAYVDYVNGLALCGYNDWRMPSQDEMNTFCILHGEALSFIQHISHIQIDTTSGLEPLTKVGWPLDFIYSTR
jgi:hypothetical protein